MIRIHRIGTSKQYYVEGFGIRGTRTDIRRWAALCRPGEPVVIIKEGN